MSSSNRTTSKGGKGPKTEKSHKNDKTDSGKHTNDHKPAGTGGGGGDNARSKSDDPNAIKERIRQVMECTHKSEEEACLALHECDHDVERAADMLLDEQWGITVKKRKSRQASSSKQENTEGAPATVGSVDDWNDSGHGGDKEKPRNKSGGPPRLHGRHNDSRGWRGREKQENERNLEDGGRHSNQDHRDRRGRPGGPTRGSGGGRGRGGGRAGGRFPPRGNRSNTFNSRPMETWDNSNTWDSNTATNHTENWDDGPIDEWSAEEYTGSLADTKVFTPSVQPDVPKEAETVMPTRSPLPEERNQLSMQQGHVPSQSPVPIVGTLNAAQTQYLSQLTQQNSEIKTSHIPTQPYGSPVQQGTPQQHYSSSSQYGAAHTNAYTSTGYPVVNAANYGSVQDVQSTQQPVRTKTQRARVPPPSKIPSSAVEMPGDLKSIALLDVQFGAMDLMDNASFDSVTDAKFNSANSAKMEGANTAPIANLDLSSTNQNSSMDPYSQQKTNVQSSISPGLPQSLSNTETIPQTSEHLSSGYNATAARPAMAANSATSATPSAMELNKQTTDPHSSYSQSSSYMSYQPKSSSYQSQNYSSANYSTTQTTSSYVSNQPNSYVSNNSASSYTPSASNAYQNAYSSSSSYQSNTAAGFPPSMSQANSYPSSNQTYQQNASQSVYGANTGLNSNSNYGNTSSSASQYNNYNSTANHKLVKENTYDNSTTVVSSTVTSTASVSTVASTLSLSQTTASSTKATTTLAKNSSGVVSNIPPGVTPVMSTPYIMGQIPYFQQPIYSYEDMQLLQQRLPHMTTPYYEMSYQTPTTLTAVRDQPLATYSMSDARFTRGDNNASPVPSTISQQTSTLTQGHQAQPILAQTGPYFFAAPYNPMQSYQFGAVYSQIPAATNAHGSSNSTQYPKPSSYGSGYGSGYDALSQSQDYNKGGYVGNAQGQTKGSGANALSSGTSGNDLSAMYGKSHTATGKVNSYDKQGFHSGTPPPFSGALHGSQSAGLAPSGSGYGPQMYIPTMPPHQQHHSTQMMPLHQMDVRHQGRRMDSGNTTGQRSQSTNQTKSGGKQNYPAAYWNPA